MSHLVHIPIDPRAFSAWAGSRDLSVRGVFDVSHAMHVLLTALFGQKALQPWRLFDPDRGAWSLYGVAPAGLQGLRETADLVGPPDLLPLLDLRGAAEKKLPEAPLKDTRVGFDVRLNPVRRRQGRNGQPGGFSDQDAWLSYQDRRKVEPDLPELDRQGAYARWFAERLEGAAEMESFRLGGYRRVRMVRSGRVHEAPEITAQGTLKVTDPAAFANLLKMGIGRSKAYGFGLLLLRPADPAPL